MITPWPTSNTRSAGPVEILPRESLACGGRESWVTLSSGVGSWQRSGWGRSVVAHPPVIS